MTDRAIDEPQAGGGTNPRSGPAAPTTRLVGFADRRPHVTVGLVAFALRGIVAVGLFAGFLVVVWPSQVIFSAVTLRDALIPTALVAIALVVHRAAERTLGRAHFGYGVAMVALLCLLAILKPSTTIVAAGALVAAVVLVIGTAFRHRAEVFWLVAILATTWTVDRYGSGRRTPA